MAASSETRWFWVVKLSSGPVSLAISRAAVQREPEVALVLDATVEHSWGPIAIGAAVSACLYLPTLGYGFLWDDPRLLGEALPALVDWRTLLFPPPGVADFDRYYRPLAYGLIWMLDRIGGGQAYPFHVTAVLLNAICTGLVASLAFRLLPRGRARVGGALAAGLWFATNPIHVEAVAWVGASMNELPTTVCLLLSLLAYDRARREGTTGPYAVALVFAFLALSSKETALALPPLAAALELGPSPSRGRDLRGSLLRIAGLGLPLGVYLLLRRAALGGWLTSPAARGGSVEPTFDAAAPAAWYYLERLLVPLRSCPFNFEIPELGAGGLAALVLLGAAAVALATRALRRGPFAVVYGIAWVVVALGPPVALAVYTVATTPLAERYAYLPSIGIALIIGGAMAAAGRWQRPAWAALVPLVAGFAWVTVQRQAVHADDGAFWTAARECAPAHCLPVVMQADQRLAAADTAGAEELYRLALGLVCNSEWVGLARAHLGVARFRHGDLEAAEMELRAALALVPHYSVPRYMLGRLAIGRSESATGGGDPIAARAHLEDARDHLEAAVARRPNDAEYLYALGQVEHLVGDAAGAREHLRHALERDPNHPAAAPARAILASMR